MGFPTGFPPDLEFPFRIPLGICLDQDSLQDSPRSPDYPTGSPQITGLPPGFPPGIIPGFLQILEFHPGFPLGFPWIQDFPQDPHRIAPDHGIPYRIIPDPKIPHGIPPELHVPLESPLKFLLGFPQDSPQEFPLASIPPNPKIPLGFPLEFPQNFSPGIPPDPGIPGAFPG